MQISICLQRPVGENGHQPSLARIEGQYAMTEGGRVVTANLPEDLVLRMDEIASRMDRSKSWIIRQAVSEWIAQEQRRYELTLEALKDVDEGRTFSHEEVMRHFAQRKLERGQG